MKTLDEEIQTCNDGNCNNEQTMEALKARVSELDTRYWKLLDRYKISSELNTSLSMRIKKGLDASMGAYDSLGYSCIAEIIMALTGENEKFVMDAMVNFRAMNDWQDESI